MKKSFVGLALLLVVTALNVMADPPTGTFEVEFDDPALRIWDPTGSYSESLDPDGDWDVSYTLKADGGGNLTGSGVFTFDSCALGVCLDIDGDFTITGKMSSGKDTVRVKIDFDMYGQGIVQGYNLMFFAKMKVTTEMNPMTSRLMGTVNGNVKVEIPGEGKGSAKMPKSEFQASMPAGSDGVWTLMLNLQQPDPDKPDVLGGNAMVTLSSGLTMALDTVKGKYKSKTDETKLSLKASKDQPESKGVSLKLETEPGGNLDLRKLKGKVAKQKVALDRTKGQGGSAMGPR